MNPISSYWEITGVEKPQVFFESLIGMLPANSIINLQDASFSDEIKEFVEKHSIEVTTKVPSGTIISFPKGSNANLPATEEVLAKLADFATRHASPEIALHIVIFKNNESVMEWHDAFGNVAYFNKIYINRQQIDKFNKANNSTISEESSPKQDLLINLTSQEELIKYTKLFPVGELNEIELESLLEKIESQNLNNSQNSTLLSPYYSQFNKNRDELNRRLYFVYGSVILFIVSLFVFTYWFQA